MIRKGTLMMMRILISIAFVLALTFNCVAQQKDCQRHAEPSAGFSVCPPEGWTTQREEGQKYAAIFGKRGEVFTPNLNFKDEANSALLADYVAASQKNILTNYEKLGATSIRVVDQGDFRTDAGLAGLRVSFSTLYKGLVIRTLQYYFNGKAGQKLIITGTALEVDREANDKIFDGAARTFRLEP
jgi:hypothetical protein